MRPPPPSLLRLTTRHRPRLLRTLSTRRTIPVPTSSAPQPLKITPLCPPPTTKPCGCNPPESEGMEIDRHTPLGGTMPRYYAHVVVATGRSDWASKIEFDTADPGGGLAGRLKALQSARGAGLRDPFAPTLVTNSSLVPETNDPDTASAYVFPAGIYFPRLPLAASEALIRRYLLPDPAASGELQQTPPPPTPTPVRSVQGEELLPEPQHVVEPMVLICSHTSRDARCGAYYPVLKAEFERVLAERGVKGVKVAATSHLSGHKFAGNVVVYMPGGWGVWYGRVGVEEVEGIVQETVLGGRVVGSLLRGVVGRDVDDV